MDVKMMVHTCTPKKCQDLLREKRILDSFKTALSDYIKSLSERDKLMARNMLKKANNCGVAIALLPKWQYPEKCEKYIAYDTLLEMAYKTKCV